jgi:hypothetical protein
MDAFGQPWHKFTNSVAVGIRLLHSIPFMNSRVHFLIAVEPVTSQASLRGPADGNPMGQCQNYGVECPEVVIGTSAVSLGFVMHCVGLHCCAEGSYLVTCPGPL